MFDKSRQQNMKFAAVAVRTLKSHIRQLHNFMLYKSPQQIEKRKNLKIFNLYIATTYYIGESHGIWRY